MWSIYIKRNDPDLYWDDLQIDPHVSLYESFKIQFAGIVPVFVEFNGVSSPGQTTKFQSLTSKNLQTEYEISKKEDILHS